MSLKHALAATELYLQHNENPLLKRGLDIKELAKTMTNGDRIRAMTDEDYAKIAAKHIPLHSWPDAVRDIYFSSHISRYGAWLEWFQQPVKEVDHDL